MLARVQILHNFEVKSFILITYFLCFLVSQRLRHSPFLESPLSKHRPFLKSSFIRLSPSNTEEFAAQSISPLIPPTRTEQINSTEKSSLDKINDTLGVIAKYLGDIKSEIKELKETQNDILLRLSSTSAAPTSLPEHLQIPVKETQDLNKLEVWLEEEEYKELLKNNLSYIGGNKTPTITRRILERVFTNSFAVQ